jgi:hypothetical protein
MERMDFAFKSTGEKLEIGDDGIWVTSGKVIKEVGCQ